MEIKTLIIYEDDDYIVINKPPGLLTIPDRFEIFKENLLEILEGYYNRVYIIHRIDKDTSGIVCFAKNPLAHKELTKRFFLHEVEKTYLAVVYGNLPTKEGKIELPISQDKNNPQRMKIDFKDGKESITFYKVLEEFKDYTLLELKPLTGRRHQIRIHLTTIGYPVVADQLYSGKNCFYLSSIKKNYKKKNSEKPLIERQALHSYKIKFFHFRKKQQIELTAPLPKDMQLLIKYLRKYNKKV
ncbi:MAG: RluA family pseudouridine synthase [Endomicrobiia bacterium]